MSIEVHCFFIQIAGVKGGEKKMRKESETTTKGFKEGGNGGAGGTIEKAHQGKVCQKRHPDQKRKSTPVHEKHVEDIKKKYYEDNKN